jgi:hypothetical protein
VRQVTDVGNELPDLPIRHVPGGHPRVSDAVADVIEHLAVRHRTDGDAKGRRMRIFAAAYPRPSATIIGVAYLAILSEQIAPGDDIGGIRPQRIGRCSRRRRNTLVQKPGRDRDFELRRHRPRARQAGDNPFVRGAAEDDHDENDDDRDAIALMGHFHHRRYRVI